MHAIVEACFDLALAAWISPTFPIGSFAYSHGLEWAHESGDVTDAASLIDWLRDILSFGSGRTDIILLAEAFRAISVEDVGKLRQTAELALALSPSQERRLESAAQGRALIVAARSAWPCHSIETLQNLVGNEVAHSVAFGVLAAGHSVGLTSAMLKSCSAYLFGFTSNLVSSAVRLGSIGQTDGQKVVSQLIVDIAKLARDAAASSLDDLGSCGFKIDISSMQHEVQYSRLFRS